MWGEVWLELVSLIEVKDEQLLALVRLSLEALDGELLELVKLLFWVWGEVWLELVRL